MVSHVGQSDPRVDDIIHDEDVLTLYGNAGAVEDLDGRGTAPGLGQVDYAEGVAAKWNGDRAHEIGHEHEAVLQKTDDDEIFAFIGGRDLKAQGGDARRDLLGSEEWSRERRGFHRGESGRRVRL
jgi:hypothetical protein